MHVCAGVLNLVDLAGSPERLSQSGSDHEAIRLKETKNKSLCNLGNVVMAIFNKDHHVPYRDSKLIRTYYRIPRIQMYCTMLSISKQLQHICIKLILYIHTSQFVLQAV